MRREVEVVLEEEIRQLLLKLVNKSQVDEVFNRLIISKQQTEIINYKKDLLKIAVKYQKQGLKKEITI